jgi:glycosyltransferase involved in cell wall biosynthesis
METNGEANVFIGQKTMYNSISIIIPVYNEALNILDTLFEVQEKVSTPHQIFLIYDFEEDNTLPVVKDFMHQYQYPNIHLVKNKYGKGVLNAIKTGFATCTDEVILVVMADLSDDLGNVDLMFNTINQGYDIVCGSRYMEGGKQISGPRFKKLLSKTAGLSLRYLLNMPTCDVTNNFKMYTKKVLDNINIESNGGFELAMEITIKAFLKNYRITELPCIWHDRTHGTSRFRLSKWLPKYIYWYLYAFKKLSIKK